MYTLIKIKHVTNERFPRILSPWHRIPATANWLSQVDFVSKKKEDKKKKNAFLVLEEKN